MFSSIISKLLLLSCQKLTTSKHFQSPIVGSIIFSFSLKLTLINATVLVLADPEVREYGDEYVVQLRVSRHY